MEHPLKPLYLLSLLLSTERQIRDCVILGPFAPELYFEYLSKTDIAEEEDRGQPLKAQTPYSDQCFQFRFVRKSETSKLLSSLYNLEVKNPFRPTGPHQTGAKSCEGTEEPLKGGITINQQSYVHHSRRIG